MVRPAAAALAALLTLPAAALARPGPAALVARDPLASAPARALARGPGAVRATAGDLTADGRPDLLVTLSDGPAGVVAYFVYVREGDGSLRDALPVEGLYRARVALRGRRLVERLPVYRARDRVCCPSSAQTTAYRWDDGGFVVQARTRSPRRSPG